MEYMEFSAKTVQDAITEACTHFVVTSSSLEYEVIDEGSTGFLGIGSKPAIIKARAKSEEIEEAKAVFTQDSENEKKEAKKEFKKEKKEFKDNITPPMAIPPTTSSTPPFTPTTSQRTPACW